MNMHCGSVTCLQVHDWILCCEPTTAADQKVMEKAKGDRLRAKGKNSGLLLSEESKEALRVVGGYHNKLLLSLHIRYKGFCCYLLFNVRPKFHMQVHMLETAAQTGRNPVVQANWMEEDFVRTVANLAKKTHKRTSHLTTLLRYTAGH